MELAEVLKKLQQHLDNTPRLNHGEPQAGVLVPFFEKDDLAHLLLTLRSSSLNKHSGQISFPGGKVDSTDKNIIHTALRETEEEVGLSPQDVEIIGKFHDFQTPYYRAVTPVIGTFSHPKHYVKSEIEIEEILEVPVEDLLDKNIHHTEEWRYHNQEYTIHFFDWVSATGKEHMIWGATAGVVHKILNIIRE